MTRRDEPFLQIVISIAAFILWSAFMLLYVLFWSSNFNWLQSFAIVVFSLLITAGLVGLMWVYWGFKHK